MSEFESRGAISFGSYARGRPGQHASGVPRGANRRDKRDRALRLRAPRFLIHVIGAAEAHTTRGLSERGHIGFPRVAGAGECRRRKRESGDVRIRRYWIPMKTCFTSTMVYIYIYIRCLWFIVI